MHGQPACLPGPFSRPDRNMRGIGFLLLFMALIAIAQGCTSPMFPSRSDPSQRTFSPADEEQFLRLRLSMVSDQLRARDVRDERVLNAMRRVPRHRFVPGDLAGSAYADNPLPLMLGQTISQPYIVGYMTQALALHGGERVLEIGTGS